MTDVETSEANRRIGRVNWLVSIRVAGGSAPCTQLKPAQQTTHDQQVCIQKRRTVAILALIFGTWNDSTRSFIAPHCRVHRNR